MTHTTQDKRYDPKFFEALEEVLDEHFPKIEEEGVAKRENRRGAALMLFAEANLIHSRLLASQKERVLGSVMNSLPQKAIYDSTLPLLKKDYVAEGYNLALKHVKEILSSLSETIKKEI